MKIPDGSNDKEMICRELASHNEDIEYIDKALNGMQKGGEIFLQDIPSELTCKGIYLSMNWVGNYMIAMET